jgi:oligo-alginate lyase
MHRNRILPLFAFLVVLPLCVAQSQARFPKEEPERAFASLKVFDEKGSPVRAAREDWAGAKERIATDPAWDTWLKERRAAVDAWITEPRDRAEYVAGWWHDFVNDKDGAFLEWTPEPPRNVGPKVFGGWVFGLRSRNGDMMVEAARMWRLTGEQRYFDWAAGQLDFYAENYAKWPLQESKSKSRLMHQSLDDANMLVRFVEAARTLEGDVPEAHREGWAARRHRWVEQLFRPMTLLLDETFQRVHNIACWQRAAMAMAAIYTDDADLWARAVDGEFGIRRQVRDGITSDYLWLEQSLGYNRYVVRAFLPLLHLAGITGRLDELREESAAIQNLMLAPSVLRFPGGWLPTPADTTGKRKQWPEYAVVSEARRVFPTRLVAIDHRVVGRTWGQLLDPVAAPPPLEREEEDALWRSPESRSLESSRMALLKREDWQVFFHYGQLDRSHAQAEALSYEAFHGETDVTHDAGTVGYGSPLHAGYYRTAAAHNVALIDGEGQQGWDEGELLRFDAERARVTARQPRYRENAGVTRQLSIEDDRLVEETTITTTDGGSHRLGIIVHVQGKVKVPREARPTATQLAQWQRPRRWRAPFVTELAATIGGKPFRIRMTAPRALTVLHAQVPDAPPNKREALYFEVRGKEARFRLEWITE